MPDDEPIPIRVIAEGASSGPWAYAIVYGRARDVLVRSQATFASRDEAIAAGDAEIKNVGRNLRRASHADNEAK